MDVQVIPVLSDNYAYLIIDTATRQAAAVDPVEPEVVLAAAKKAECEIACILTTHSHWDHAGGNKALVSKLPYDIEVYGGKGDRAEGVSHEVGDGDVIKVGSNVTITTIFAPCHTPGHVLYCASSSSSPAQALFTGDTLFVGGCGNFNSGTPAQMQANFEAIAALPDDTLIYCGHEYTTRNLSFGLYAEPANEKIKEKLEWSKATPITVPSTVGSEKETNVFMRVKEDSIKAFTGCGDDAVEGMRLVRKMKDDWGRTH